MNLKKYLIFSFVLFVIGACSASKKAEKSLESGNYDQAFDIGFTELSKDKSDEKLIRAFKQAYDKANERDLRQIEELIKTNNAENLKKIYALYEKIDARQYQVISLKPLYIGGNEVDLKVTDYSNEIATAKANYSKFLYDAANAKMNTGNKLDAREAYKLYSDLEFVNPGYVSNLPDLVAKAKMKGSSIILLKLDNKIVNQTTDEDVKELTRISESNMNNPWLVFHDKKDKNVTYDHEISILLNKFSVTPQQVNSQVVPQQARVKDGWEYIYDAKGNVMKDSLGNDMKRDKIITVQAEINIFQQVKSGAVEGNLTVKNLKTNSQTATTPVVGEAKFENQYALYRGDQRAIEQKYYEVLQKKEVPFPPDNEFVKYSLSDFKAKMMDFINQQQL
jgi:hypothetical protein